MKKFDDITRSAATVGSLTLLSRILGYVRDMVVAYFFGAAAATDAFYVAFRIPNLLRRLFAEGSLTIAFIPVFTETLERGGKAESKRALNATFTWLVIILSVLVVAGVVFSPAVIKLFAAGFDAEASSLAVGLNRVMFPYILLISLVALAMGVLNSLRHFFAPAISPLLLNVAVIASVLLLRGFFEVPIYALAVGVILGGVLQLLFQLPFLIKKGFLPAFTTALSHPAAKQVGRLMSPQLFGLAVYNLNILVSTQFASFMPEGTVSYLYYAERLIEFPLGIAAVSIATALLPALSRKAVAGDTQSYREHYAYALRLMLFVMLPALVGLIALRVPICTLLYERGEFTHASTLLTAQTLLGYAIGLWAVGGVRITAPTFYALKDTRTPVIVAFVSLLVNAVFGYVLGFVLELRHMGLALASSISSMFYFLTLFVLINRRMGRVALAPMLGAVGRMGLAAAAMGAGAWYISGFADWSVGGATLYKTGVLGCAVVLSGGLYFALSWVLGVEETGHLANMLRRRGPR